MTVMSGELFRGGGGGGSEERVCITQHEQREYDACSLEPQEFPGGQQGGEVEQEQGEEVEQEQGRGEKLSRERSKRNYTRAEIFLIAPGIQRNIGLQGS